MGRARAGDDAGGFGAAIGSTHISPANEARFRGGVWARLSSLSDTLLAGTVDVLVSMEDNSAKVRAKGPETLGRGSLGRELRFPPTWKNSGVLSPSPARYRGVSAWSSVENESWMCFKHCKPVPFFSSSVSQSLKPQRTISSSGPVQLGM